MKKNNQQAKSISKKNFEISELPADYWKDAQNQSMKQGLIPITTWLGFLLVVFSISHLFLLNPAIAIPMSIMTGITALFLFGILFLLRKIDLPLMWAHPTGALIICLILINCLAIVILSDDIYQSVYLILLILGISVFIVDDHWFFLLIISTLFCWGLTIIIRPTLEFNPNTILALLTSVGLGIVSHFNHVNILKKLTTSDYLERLQKDQLEKVLEEMKSSNDQLLLTNTALKAAANGIVITNRNGEFLWVNPAFTKMTGYSSEEVIGKKPNILKSGFQDDAFYKKLWETITNGNVWVHDMINRRKDGTFYHEEQTITPVPDEKGEITHFIGVKQDISMRISAQKALEQHNQELLQLNKAISIITSSLDLAEVEKNIVETAKHILPNVFGATLQLIDEDENLATKMVTDSITHNIIKQTPGILFRKGIGASGIAVQKRSVVNINDIDNDPRFLKGENYSPPFRSLVVIPIIYKKRIYGTLSIEGTVTNAFGRQEERLLKLLGDYSAAAIQNAIYSEHLEEMVEARTLELKLAQEKLFAQQQLEQEIKLAVNIQESLLPHHMPELPGFSIAAAAIPAHSVSGDFYDFVVTNEKEVSFILADIAGKGIPAAMLTSTARSLIRLSADQGQSPAVALCEVNSRLYDDLTHAEMFITMLVAQLNYGDGKIKYANAGHTEVLWWHQHNQSCTIIPVTGIPLGVLKEFELSELEIMVRPGDILLLYSDGITEAMNLNDQLFGLDRLKTLLKENYEEESDSIILKILDAVDNFCQGLPHSDDITLIVLKAFTRHIPFVFPASLDQLDAISSLIRRNADAFGPHFAYQIELATSEIITNIIDHAYSTTQGDLRGEISVFNDRMEIDFFDNGITFDPSILPEVDLNQLHEGGYGLFIVHQLIDDLVYTPATLQGNHWHLVKIYHELEQS